MVTLEQALNCIYTDLRMLQDGENWASDKHAVEASIYMVERIGEILDIGLQDTREKI